MLPSPGRRGLLLLVLGTLFVTQCGRRGPSLPPPSEPLPPAPTEPAEPPPDRGAVLQPQLELRIEPAVINRGESALLTWKTSHAESVRIDPNIGPVDLSGRIKFFPDETTTYEITAQGQGGKTNRSVTVQVIPGSGEGVSVENVTGLSLTETFSQFVKPVFFTFDSAELSQEAKLTLDRNIAWLSQPEYRRLPVLLEGHADSRGSEEYNLALSDLRAQVVKQYLIEKGVDLARVQTVSLGEERPFDRGSTEEAYARNRRTQFVLLDSP